MKDQNMSQNEANQKASKLSVIAGDTVRVYQIKGGFIYIGDREITQGPPPSAILTAIFENGKSVGK